MYCCRAWPGHDAGRLVPEARLWGMRGELRRRGLCFSGKGLVDVDALMWVRLTGEGVLGYS